LPALEPIARNAAVRRANPSNRWLLSTNTDMVFVPLQPGSMSEICSTLPDGFYALPRFEIPEWLWERLPRSDPGRALAEIQRLGPALKLDEPTVSHEWIRFDAPGDFQLILRDDFVAIDGFDEEMLLGYHVDSNMSRRLLLRRGSIESLEGQLAGYHCNHNRTRTVYHGTRRVENDLQRFFFSIDEPALPAQRTTWGLPDVVVEEVPLRERVGTRSAVTLTDVIPPGPRVPSDAYRAPFSLTYDSGHVLPFVVDALVVSSPDAEIGYVGANQVLERFLSDVVTGLGFNRPMSVARVDDRTDIEQIAESADVFVIDLGLDISEGDDSFDAVGENRFSQVPEVLTNALFGLHRLVELERTRCEQGKHPRPMVLVNSSSGFWDAYVLAQFDCSYTTTHSRVRRATVKLVPEEDPAAIEAELVRSYRLMRWYSRDREGRGSIKLRSGETIELYEIENYSAFGAGWATPEDTGMWTEGKRATLRIAADGIEAGEFMLALWLGMICVGPGEALTVDLLANGDHLATREFSDSVSRAWRLDLPAQAIRDTETEITFVVHDPRSPVSLGWSSDDRLLGIHIRTLTLEPVDRFLRLGQKIEFCEGSDAQRFVGDGWSYFEPTGIWTIEDSARLAFRVQGAVPPDVELELEVVPFVTAKHQALAVEVWSRGQRLAERTFRYERGEQPMQILRVRPPDGVIDNEGRASIELRVRNPARPVELGLGSDPRRLGIYLVALTVKEPGTDVLGEAPAGPLGKLRSQLIRSLRS
jgi:hypothetical protein